MRKLGPVEHDRYTSFILPQKAGDFSFAETVQRLTELFVTRESLLSKRIKCLQIAKHKNEDHMSYACRLNKACVGFAAR